MKTITLLLSLALAAAPALAAPAGRPQANPPASTDSSSVEKRDPSPAGQPQAHPPASTSVASIGTVEARGLEARDDGGVAVSVTVVGSEVRVEGAAGRRRERRKVGAA